MIERYLLLKDHIDSCFMDSHSDMLLDDSEVRELTILKDFLKPFKLLTMVCI